jgi:23S rRNA pseudouridine955/2504/2580 synthase/23S rRNA pseudouridine1911/1915/1917 synthase
MSIIIHVPDYILFEDEYILVINKPAGLMVEPDRNGHPNLLQQVKKYLKGTLPAEEEVYAQHLHRLDRPVSGIVLFAKQRSVLKNLSEQFAERKVKKYYQALSDQAPLVTRGTLEHWHRKEKKKAVLYDSEIQYSEKALLTYEVSELNPNLYLWNIELHTGKYHQIRAQLAQTGCPIIGDSLYGSSMPYVPDGIALHACKLIFSHPITNEVISIEKKSEFKETQS